ETLRTWRIGRSNESSLLGTLRFLGVIEEHRSTLPEAKEVFTAPTDDEFARRFAEMVKEAYRDLFDQFGEAAWTLSRDELISFMRAADRSSTRVSDQQAVTFQALARHAGHGTSKFRSVSAGRRHLAGSMRGVPPAGDAESLQGAASFEPPTAVAAPSVDLDGIASGRRLGITINLPTTADPAVYDASFGSMREHLFGGRGGGDR